MAKKTKTAKQSKSRKSAMGTAASRHEFFKADIKKHKKAVSKGLVTPFVDGNDFWIRRAKHGRDQIFSNPDAMLEDMVGYFNYAKTRTWTKKEWKTTNGKLKMVEVPTTPPFTWDALALYVGVSHAYFRTFKATIKQDNPHRADFLAVIEWADGIIRNHKMEGASVGVYNAQLISYDLGIRKDMPQGSSAGVVINVNENKDKSLLNDVMNRLNDLDKEEDK